MHNVVNFLKIVPIDILRNVQFAIRNGALFIHQSKRYSLGTYSVHNSILGDRCSREK